MGWRKQSLGFKSYDQPVVSALGPGFLMPQDGVAVAWRQAWAGGTAKQIVLKISLLMKRS